MLQIDFVNRMDYSNVMRDQDVSAANGARWDQKPPETIPNAQSQIQAGQNTAQVTLPSNGVIGFRYQRMNVPNPPAWVDVTITNQNGLAQVTNNNNYHNHLHADVDTSNVFGAPGSPLGGNLTITFDGV